ncbi:putative caulimovirus coat protein [Helianthus anomalus]
MSSNHRVNQTTTSSSNKHSNRKKSTEFYMPYHKGIPDFNNNNGSSVTINTIKIDCIFNFNKRKDVIDKWNTEISLIILTNPDELSHAKALLLLVEHKSAGITQDFINGTTWNEDLHGEDLFDQIINGIYMMFLGIDFMTNKDQESQKLLEKARQNLAKAQLCDICLLDDFTCFYEANLYKLSSGEFHSWIDAYLMKIPIVGEKAKERGNREKNHFTMHSLGFVTKIVKEEIATYCDFSNKQTVKTL